MKHLLAFFLLLFTGSVALAQRGFEPKLFIQKKDTLPYQILLPINYDPGRMYPMVLFLHGAGERGSDNQLQLTHGAKLFLQDSIRKKYPAIVIFPQCPAESFWSNVTIGKDEAGNRTFNFQPGGEPTKAMALLEKLVARITHVYPVNPKQVYVGGLSMGGMGTFELVRRKPKLFAAAFAICGGANASTAPGLTNTSWWVFHGAKDDVVPLSASETIVAALKAAHADVQFTIYPEANHNSWDSAFAEPNFMAWLFAHKKVKRKKK